MSCKYGHNKCTCANCITDAGRACSSFSSGYASCHNNMCAQCTASSAVPSNYDNSGCGEYTNSSMCGDEE